MFLALRALLGQVLYVRIDIRFGQPVTLPRRIVRAHQQVGIRQPKAPFRHQPLTSQDVRVLAVNRLLPSLSSLPGDDLHPSRLGFSLTIFPTPYAKLQPNDFPSREQKRRSRNSEAAAEGHIGTPRPCRPP